MPENILIILPDVAPAWTAAPALPVAYWIDPNGSYFRTENGTIIVTETGEPFAP